MDLKLKAYLKVTGIVLSVLALAFLSALAFIAIAKTNLVQENYQAIQDVASICFIATFALLAIYYFISIVAEAKVSHEVQKLKYKEREEYEKSHKCDWQMRGVYILSIVMIVLMIMIGFLGLCAKNENLSNPNQSVKMLNIEN